MKGHENNNIELPDDIIIKLVKYSDNPEKFILVEKNGAKVLRAAKLERFSEIFDEKNVNNSPLPIDKLIFQDAEFLKKIAKLSIKQKMVILANEEIYEQIDFFKLHKLYNSDEFSILFDSFVLKTTPHYIHRFNNIINNSSDQKINLIMKDLHEVVDFIRKNFVIKNLNLQKFLTLINLISSSAMYTLTLRSNVENVDFSKSAFIKSINSAIYNKLQLPSEIINEFLKFFNEDQGKLSYIEENYKFKYPPLINSINGLVINNLAYNSEVFNTQINTKINSQIDISKLANCMFYGENGLSYFEMLLEHLNFAKQNFTNLEPELEIHRMIMFLEERGLFNSFVSTNHTLTAALHANALKVAAYIVEIGLQNNAKFNVAEVEEVLEKVVLNKFNNEYSELMTIFKVVNNPKIASMFVEKILFNKGFGPQKQALVKYLCTEKNATVNVIYKDLMPKWAKGFVKFYNVNAPQAPEFDESKFRKNHVYTLEKAKAPEGFVKANHEKSDQVKQKFSEAYKIIEKHFSR